MIILFETFQQSSCDVWQSLKLAGFDYPTVVLTDDGFLPDGVESPFSYFTGDLVIESEERPLYFNRVKIPSLWEIESSNTNGRILDNRKRRANIFYREPTHRRYVRTVEWVDEQDRVRSIDYYNKRGRLFSKQYFNHFQEAIHRHYYDQNGRIVITENHRTGTIVLELNNKTTVFPSKQAFLAHYLDIRGYRQEAFFYNSLSTPFLYVYEFGQERNHETEDILFWQEPIQDNLPGNMIALLEHSSVKTKIVVPNHTILEKMKRLAKKEWQDKFHYLGYLYHYHRLNNQSKNALILTNSDQLEKIDELIQKLPELHFHIGALTEMSSHLLRLEDYHNVTLYPTIQMAKVDELYQLCDIYLDINHVNEILGAVRRAFENNMLILAFEQTCHNPAFIAPGHIYNTEDGVYLMAEIVDKTLADSYYMEQALQGQKKHANQSQLEDYQLLVEKGDA